MAKTQDKVIRLLDGDLDTKASVLSLVENNPVAVAVLDGNGDQIKNLSGSIITDKYDYIGVTYVASGNGAGEIETAIYKTGGASGTVVGTLTLAYNADNKLISVTKT